MEIFDFLNTSRFVPRAKCGEWTQALIWLHNWSDFFIWSAYVAIPLVLVSFAWRRRREELPFRHLFWLFGLFIVACGTTHLMDIILFYEPLYVLSGWIKLITAAASWGTVLALFHVVPRALQMKTPDALEREVQERTAQLQEANARLEAANSEKDELLRREQEARREAEEANRTKDAFLATVSHELRTPLTSILGWSSLVRGGANDDDTLQKAMSAIERNSRAQSQIIDDLLDVSRIVTGKLKLDVHSLELSPVVDAALDAVRPAARAKTIEIVVYKEPSGLPVKVRGDAARLQQIVWNLVSNAVKFTPKGGRVEVSLLRDESHAVITVSDNGQGIPPEFLPHVFERFRQADSSSTRAAGGLGLGLAIARHLVEMHGGNVEARSEGSGQGARFIVRLPLLAVDDEVAQSQEGDAQLPPDVLGGLNILVVEDDADSRQLISTILTRYGATTESAANAAAGFEWLKKWRPDVLISDIGLPGEDGYQLMQRIRALPVTEGGQTPAAALTAFAGPRDRLQALTAGFQVHLAKPVDPDELVATAASLAGRNLRR